MRSRARLVFSVGGMWRGAGDDRSTAELSGVVTEAGTDRHLPVEGTLTVRLGRVVHTELHLRFGDGRITAARDVDLAPTSLPRILGQTQQFLGQVLHQVAAPGQIRPARHAGRRRTGGRGRRRLDRPDPPAPRRISGVVR